MNSTRKLKVNYKSSNDKYVPAIILQGKWLEEYGFQTGTYISVECENGKLTITPREPNPEESHKNIEDRISTLGKSQKRKLTAFLDELDKE